MDITPRLSLWSRRHAMSVPNDDASLSKSKKRQSKVRILAQSLIRIYHAIQLLWNFGETTPETPGVAQFPRGWHK